MAQVRMMSRILVLMMLAAGPAFAQQKPAPAPAGKTPPKAAERPQPTPEGQPVNVRIEVTITDQHGESAPVTKTVTSTVADRSWGRIRTNGDVNTPMGFRTVLLNVDAFPRLLKEGLLKVDLTIEYRPDPAGAAETGKASTPAVNETLTVMLQDGKSMLISQSADPATDRKVKVEAKATILK